MRSRVYFIITHNDFCIADNMFGYQNGSSFSTLDKDQDNWAEGQCAVQTKGAWWYDSCGPVNLNGQYEIGSDLPRCMHWMHWPQNNQRSGLRGSKMAIRPSAA